MCTVTVIPTPPIATQCLAPKYAKFFNKNYVPALGVSVKFDVNAALLLGLSAHESGYGTSPMYLNQNNPTGQTPGGDSTAGLSYRSLAVAWQRWGDRWGASVRGVGSNGTLFVNQLKSAGYNSEVAPGGTPGWRKLVLGTISGVQRRMAQWAVHPECS